MTARSPSTCRGVSPHARRPGFRWQAYAGALIGLSR